MSLAAEDTWTRKADMPTARVFAGGCVIDGKIYVIGGAPSASSVTGVVEMYNPISDSWTRMANIPSGRCYPATCAFNDKIYVFGGTSPGMYSTAKKNVYVYDPQTDSWTQKADMQYANALCGIAVVDDIIYLIGGGISESSSPISTVMAYNPVNETWTQKADMPTARSLLSASVVDGKIYAIGGSTQNWRAFAYKKVEVYDPSTDTWTSKSDMPSERWSLGTCVVNGKIFAIGGGVSASYGSSTANEVYDTITDTWTTKSPMQHKRYGLCVASVGNKIYAIGGSVPTILSTVEEYDTGFIITPPSPDFNGDGIVDIKDLLRIVESWNQNDPMVDIAPLPSGDGIIDVLDLELLMSYWRQPVDDPTLIAHWALDETEGDIAYDSSVVNDASIIGDPVWQPEGGIIDGALQLDGVDDYISTDPVLNPAVGVFSVFTWIKGGLPGQVVISQFNGVNWLGTDSISGCLKTGLSAPGRGGGPLQSETVITDDNWHRIGFVWYGVNRALYVDDILVAEDTQQSLESSTAGLYIGCGNGMEAGTYWSGLIDDVRIYNRAVRP
jgi:N-acetylneuraminic acid mutarotase